MNNNSFKVGLWNKQSKAGSTYAKGKVTIENKEYSVTLFTNSNKTNEKVPDYNVIIEEYIFNQDNTQKPLELAKNDQINDYKEFGEHIKTEMQQQIEITDEDLPF